MSVENFLELPVRKGFASERLYPKLLAGAEMLHACQFAVGPDKIQHRLLFLTGVPGPALSSLFVTGLSLACMDSLDGTLDPASIVILKIPLRL